MIINEEEIPNKSTFKSIVDSEPSTGIKSTFRVINY